jgi:hypothetical protein
MFREFYNRAGDLKEVGYPKSSRTVTYSFGDGGRASGVTGLKSGASTTYASAIGYSAHQAVRQLTLGTSPSRVEQRCFNSRLQPEIIRVRSNATDCTTGRAANTDDLLHLEIGYGNLLSNNGNVASQAIWPLNRSQSYSYDRINRA